MNRLTISNYGKFKIPPPTGTKEKERPSYMDLYQHLSAIEDILGEEYDLDRIQQLVDADRNGKCIILPCKKGDTVWRIVHDAIPHITKDKCTEIVVDNGNIWVGLIGNKKMSGWNFGNVLFLTQQEAKNTLRKNSR